MCRPLGSWCKACHFPTCMGRGGTWLGFERAIARTDDEPATIVPASRLSLWNLTWWFRCLYSTFSIQGGSLVLQNWWIQIQWDNPVLWSRRWGRLRQVHMSQGERSSCSRKYLRGQHIDILSCQCWWLVQPRYRLGTVNSNTVNSKLPLNSKFQFLGYLHLLFILIVFIVCFML